MPQDKLTSRIAIYSRVSTRTQTEASQAPDLERWAQCQEDRPQWFRDEFTGKTMDRPGFNELMQAIQRGEIHTVAVWRLDRFGRTARGLTALIAELTQRRVNLVSLREGLDLSTPAGRMVAHMLASVAEYETEVRAERVKAGLDAKRARGETWGGSRKGRRTRATKGKEATARRLRDKGESIASIARLLGVSRPTVYTLLK